MKQMWLYPINANTPFQVGRGRSADVGAAGFAEMIERDGSDDNWPISMNFKNVEVGDEIVVYASKTTRHPPAIIGLGTVKAKPQRKMPGDKFRVAIRWDLPTTQRMSRNPIDATWLATQLPTTKPTVTRIPAHLWTRLRVHLSTTEPDAQADIKQIMSTSSLSKTTKQQLVDARLGQGLFRNNVGRIEPGCRLTGVTDRAHLRASHIKPWHASSNKERLDGNNGFLLAPHVDHLFDRGFISFDASGRLLISPQLHLDVLKAWALTTKRTVGTFNVAQRRYLEYHRQKIFIVD